MKICFLSKSDVDKIVELNGSGFSDGWSRESLLKAFDGGRLFVIGAVKERLVGVVYCSYTQFDGDIEGICVHPDYRRQGIAKTLMEEAEKQFILNGAEKIFLEVRKSNAGAINLYLGAGYSKISVRKNYYADGEDAVVMAKELTHK